MNRRSRWGSRFDEEGADPLQALGNLVDVMLVFACGLIAALVASQRGLRLPSRAASSAPTSDVAPAPDAPREIERGRELPSVPRGAGRQGSGYEAVGRVYRDERSGRLILISD